MNQALSSAAWSEHQDNFFRIEIMARTDGPQIILKSLPLSREDFIYWFSLGHYIQFTIEKIQIKYCAEPKTLVSGSCVILLALHSAAELLSGPGPRHETIQTRIQIPGPGSDLGPDNQEIC